MITVVSALIKKDNKYLIGKRLTGYEPLIGKWEFPGGKVEKDETDEEALERELYEEFEMNIKATDYVTNSLYEYPNKLIDLKLYKCEYISGQFKLHDHSEYKWVTKEELLNYDLAPADIPLAEFVNKYL